MKKQAVLCTGIFFVAFFLTLASNAWAAAQAGIAGSVAGRVQVSRNGQWRSVWGNEPIYVGDRLKTGADGRLAVNFVDKSIMTLNPNTELEITTYLFSAGNQRVGLLKLWAGKVRSVVSKYAAGAGNDYKFVTPTAVAGVRGTDLTVSIKPKNNVAPAASPGDNPSEFLTEIAVLEGAVDVSSTLEGIAGLVRVNGGQASSVSYNEAPGTVRQLSSEEMKGLRGASLSPGKSGPQFAGGSTNHSNDSETTLNETGGDGGGGEGDGGSEGDLADLPAGPGGSGGGLPPIAQQPGDGTNSGNIPVTVEINRAN